MSQMCRRIRKELVTWGLAILPAVAAAQDNNKAPILSPRDTARATVGSAQLLVDYGRPSKRNRVIWGGLVPWGAVWRTGANAATTFVTNKDLAFGSTVVPAGTYTIYSVPNQNGPWYLVVNKQNGQWGTEYHQEQDLVRIPMTTKPVSPSVEKFAINIVPDGSGGAIALVWDQTEADAAFVVK